MRTKTAFGGMRAVFLTMAIVLASSPLVWAQLPGQGVLDDTDPALYASVQALIAHDPDIANNPELADLVRQVAEATALDPRERSAITHEVFQMHQEGVDVNTVIPSDVREAAREEFAKMQGQMQEQLETLRATDPEAAQELELMMREGELQMQAFESGEHYTPSPEMVAHAEGMMHEWESDMIAQGAPPEYIEQAHQEFAMWSSGEIGGMLGGLGQEVGGPGGMPTPEQMQAMVDSGQMTPEQLQMAKDYMQAGSEAYQAGMETYQAGMESYQAGMEAYQTGMEAYQAGMEYGQVMEQQYIEQYAPENQNYDNLQQQQFDQSQPPPTEYKIRENTHIADHDGDPFTLESHQHEIFRHVNDPLDPNDDTCHDHATDQTVSC